jgi:serine/threonine protein kinase
MIGTLVGNYKIVEKIGEGGMGSVFRGIDIMLEREVAIKMLRPEFASQPNVVERFRSEAVTLARLSHPNIATLHSFFRQRDDFFMVMEFVRGETLDHIIRSRGAISLDQALPLFCQSLDGIGYAHRMGVIHRDLKPANMMLTREGSIKVMDFGIARMLGTARMTRQGAIVGTIEYMSPEQVRGEEGDARSDVYSLGIVLYEMLTGRVPFSSTSEFELMRAQTDAAPIPPRTFVAEIPLQVEQAIMRALAKRIEARFQTAGEFRELIVRALNGATDSSLVRPAPATRPAPPALSAAAIKDTRLASGSMNSSHSPKRIASEWSSNGEIKETRLAPGAEFQRAVAPFSEDTEGARVQPAPIRQSILDKLNWKHYSGAMIAAILIGVSIAMVGFGGKETPPAATERPTEPAPPVPVPPRTDELPPQNPAAAQNTSQQDIILPLDKNRQQRSASGTSTRPGNRREVPAPSYPQASAAPPAKSPDPAPQAPVQSTPQPPREEPTVAAPKTSGTSGEKDGGVASKLGKGVKEGAKKIWGKLSGDKENKNGKKP